MQRLAEVRTVLGGELLLLRLSGTDSLSSPFQYVVDLLATSNAVDFGKLLGQPMSVLLELEDGSQREFNGLATEVAIAGGFGRYVQYRATLRPWLWLLGQRTNCRIFQRVTVPDVVVALFREHGFSDFEDRLIGRAHYAERDYLVQYRESDLQFVQRILEHEGIYYYFKHQGGKHTLVLADSPSAHEPAPGAESIPYFPPQTGEQREQEHLSGWSCARVIRSGAYAGRDFDFEKPRFDYTPLQKQPHEHAYSEFELFDYPLDFKDAAQADQRARLRLEEHQADHEIVQASGNVRAIASGCLFNLEQFPRDDQNKEYLILKSDYELRVNGYESGAGDGLALHYDVTLWAMDSKRPYRPARRTPKPVVEGPQTAIVVGQADKEIWTDEYGRVKVQFHWDRVGKYDQESSCWVRVSQLWAGSGFGGVHLPRIGQEVIVDFLEGDPDQPIITGRVYNKDNMPPYALPANSTQSGIKSRSSAGATPSNFNEIRFEDKKGEEELYIQAEKNQNTLVKANQSVTVGANQSISVGANQSISVGGTRQLTVTKADTEHFKDTRTTNVDSTDTLTITGKHTGTYDGERHETVKGLDKTEVNGNKVTTVHGTFDVTADTHYKVVQGANTFLIENKIEGVSEGPVSFTNGPCEIKLEGGAITLTAADEISLACGSASIKLTKSGAVEIVGAQKVSLGSGPSAVVVEPAGANVSGPKIGAHAIGMHEISGALVKIN